MIVYVSIGNSDDKLTQHEWSRFVRFIGDVLQANGNFHGQWSSASIDPWQNACWCVEFSEYAYLKRAKERVAETRREFHQDSVAWAEVPETQFI